MSYAVQADLLLRVTAQELVQLTDDAKTGQANAETVQGALDEATGIIDGYTRSRYQTPLQTSNEVVRICRDLAIYLLYSRRPQKMNDTARQTTPSGELLCELAPAAAPTSTPPAAAPAAATPESLKES